MKQVIPVVVINDEKETIEILSKLREGGINCAEITFRTACAKEAIAIGTKAFEDMKASGLARQIYLTRPFNQKIKSTRKNQRKR